MAYELRAETHEWEGCDPVTVTSAYTPTGAYIGDEEWAKKLEERGIVPELREADHSVCSIGFCEREQKWYGWSHRAIHGFAIGDTVEPGDIAYTADTVDGLIDEYVKFFADVCDPAETRALLTPDYENKRVWVGEKHYAATMATSPAGVALAIEQPDMMPQGTITMGGYWMNCGRGEWTAQTLDDARQMACDYAEDIS